MQKKIIVMGSINANHVLHIPHFSKPGETLKASAYQILHGGKGANQALAVARLKPEDYAVDFLACIGNDDVGEQMKQAFYQAGINTDLIATVPNTPTGIAFIQVSSTGENSIVVMSGANTHLNEARITQHGHSIVHADCLLVQLETPLNAVIQAIQLAKNEGVFVVLNPAPAQVLPNELYPNIDIITPNETETEILTGIKVVDEESAREAATYFHQKGVQIVVITLGEKGVYLSQNGEETAMLQGFRVNAVDTTAAGDIFNGALVSAILENKPLVDAISFAQAAAAISVTRFGAQPSMPTRQEVDAFLLEQAFQYNP